MADSFSHWYKEKMKAVFCRKVEVTNEKTCCTWAETLSTHQDFWGFLEAGSEDIRKMVHKLESQQLNQRCQPQFIRSAALAKAAACVSLASTSLCVIWSAVETPLPGFLDLFSFFILCISFPRCFPSSGCGSSSITNAEAKLRGGGSSHECKIRNKLIPCGIQQDFTKVAATIH
ncbi:hypothetical protein IV203_011519 [Nitzschia inconspicua]|uniref:Uncharacterized protein n=1 Tax=Nitzschia inconspicua TaxID=303405 RepID=A0A9K3KSV6_9STRA|nr:hypothetical protein IV203_011519 [Nitzschia inconspicua]